MTDPEKQNPTPAGEQTTAPEAPQAPQAPAADVEEAPAAPANSDKSSSGPTPPAGEPNFFGPGPEQQAMFQFDENGNIRRPNVEPMTKVICAVLGLFLTLFSVPLVWLMYARRGLPYFIEALKWCFFGIILSIVASMLFTNWLLTSDSTYAQIINQMLGMTSTTATGTAPAAPTTGGIF